jgi:nucleoside-diphosphate-sugar epimerase
MKILVIGGNGRLGWLIAQRALDDGHHVTTFDLTVPKFAFKHPKLKSIAGDLYKPKTLAAAMKNQEVIIFAVGTGARNPKLVCRDGMRLVLLAMKHLKIKRIIAISAYGVNEQANMGLYTRSLRFAIPIRMQDKDKMEDLMRADRNVDWTILRPAAYVPLWPKHNYLLDNVLPGHFPVVPRQAVANCVVQTLLSPKFIGKALSIKAK